jgi:rhamnose transport system permease protein
VVAVVLFGGVSIFGGRGTIFGVFLSAVIVALSQVAFTLINISTQEQQVVFGGLLLVSVIVPNAAQGYRRLRTYLRRLHRPVPAGGNP